MAMTPALMPPSVNKRSTRSKEGNMLLSFVIWTFAPIVIGYAVYQLGGRAISWAIMHRLQNAGSC